METVNKWNKLFVVVIGVIVMGLTGTETEPAYIADVLPPSWQPWIGVITAVLMALVPNGRPFWQVTKPSIGALHSHWIAPLIIGLLVLGGCQTTKGGTASATDEQIAAGLTLLMTGLEIVDAVSGGAEDDDGLLGTAGLKVEEGLAIYCAVSPEAQATMRAGIPDTLKELLVALHGGQDGDVCTTAD